MKVAIGKYRRAEHAISKRRDSVGYVLSLPRGRCALVVIGLLVLFAIPVTMVLRHSSHHVGVPVPGNLERLDPQVRDYITRQLSWVAKDPADPSRQATLGLVYAVNLLWTEARQCFSNHVRLRPNEPLGHLYLAVATQEAGDDDEALQLFRRTAEKFPGFAGAYDRLGTVLLRIGEFEEAEEVFRRLIEVVPGEWRGHAGLGEAKLRLNRFAESVECLERALSIQPASRLVHHLLGHAYRGLGRHAEAEWHMRLGLNSEQTPMPDPWGVSAATFVRLLPQQIELASEHIAAGRPAEAIYILAGALRYHPDNLIVLEHLSAAFRESGQPEKALEAARRMLALDARSVKAHTLMADACLDLAQNEEALNCANLAVGLGPELPQPLLVKADALFALGRTAEGLASRKEALQKDPQNPLIALDVGDALLHILAQPRPAREYFEKAVEMDPTLSLAHLRLAETTILLGDFEHARRSLEMAKKIDPRSAGLTNLEAQLREQMNVVTK